MELPKGRLLQLVEKYGIDPRDIWDTKIQPPVPRKPDFAMPIAVFRPLRWQGHRDYEWTYYPDIPKAAHPFIWRALIYSPPRDSPCGNILINPTEFGFVFVQANPRRYIEWVSDDGKGTGVQENAEYWQATLVPKEVARAICYDFGLVFENFPKTKANGAPLNVATKLEPEELPLLCLNKPNSAADLVAEAYKSAGETQSTRLIVAKSIDDALEGSDVVLPDNTTLAQFRLAYLLLPAGFKEKYGARSATTDLVYNHGSSLLALRKAGVRMYPSKHLRLEGAVFEDAIYEYQFGDWLNEKTGKRGGGATQAEFISQWLKERVKGQFSAEYEKQLSQWSEENRQLLAQHPKQYLQWLESYKTNPNLAYPNPPKLPPIKLDYATNKTPGARVTKLLETSDFAGAWKMAQALRAK